MDTHGGIRALYKIPQWVSTLDVTAVIVPVRAWMNADTLWGMCRAATCKKCGRPTWKGCGAHVEHVLGDVPRDERCQCRTTQATVSNRKSWFSR